MSETISKLQPSPAAWITGASGGLGQALTTAFRDAGWRVAATYHSKNIHPETDHLWPIHLDVTQHDNVSNVASQIVERWGRIDVLVNNAGLIADDSILKLSEANWDRVLDVNLKGAFSCAQAAAKVMARQGAGHIINISSFSARTGPLGQANYSAAKAGLIGLTQSLAKELGSRGVRVNAILPGVLQTAMISGLSDTRLQELKEANALQRLNSVTEVARFVCFLATMENVSGQIFQLDSRIARWT